MDAAFDRLTDVQRENINHDMFIFAYNCIAKSKYDPELLERIIVEETKECPHMIHDLKRYSIMDTLKNIRPTERINEHEAVIDDKAKTSYVTQQIKDREGAILVFPNHSEDVVAIVLSSIHPMDSGYVFFGSELILDPVSNKMVPLHRLATDQEVETLRNRHIDMRKLPILKMTDPIRRWHNFEYKTIVAIERPGSTYFRRVM